MKPFLLVLSFSIPIFCFSQKYIRANFNYQKMKTDTLSVCDENTNNAIQNSYTALEQNNSAAAVIYSKNIYESNKECPNVFGAYGYALFRNGQWEEGIKIIDSGIEKFGSLPDLIKQRSNMSLEMAQLGTGAQNIDGSTVYKANRLPYNDEQFKEENLKSALADLEFLASKYNRPEEIYYVGKIYQFLQNYDKSNKELKKLLTDIDYQNQAVYDIAENYIQLKQYNEAEFMLNELLNNLPKNAEVYSKMAEIAEMKGDTTKQTELKDKAFFYTVVPEFLDYKFNDGNLETIRVFSDDDIPANVKKQKLENIATAGNSNNTINVCIIILRLHANHGNGLEENATKILSKTGKAALPMVHKLFQSKVSTCTITNLAEIMAAVKDEESWKLLCEYLPTIANMPITLIPPSVPEKMIKFNPERATLEILKVVKPLLTQDSSGDNPMTGFGEYVYYYPLKEIGKSKLKKIAKELKYTDVEYQLLEKKIFDK